MVDLLKDPRFAEKLKSPVVKKEPFTASQILKNPNMFDEQGVFVGSEQVRPDNTSFGAATLDTAGDLAGNIGVGVGAGLSGLFQLAFSQDPERAAQAIQEFQTKHGFSPDSPRSKEQMREVADFAKGVIDKFNIPVSGIAGLGEIVAGEGIDQAGQTIANVQKQGAGATLGDRTLEETGNPLAATAAFMAPDLILEAAGLGAFTKTRPLRQSARNAAAKVGRQVSEEGKGIASEIFTTQSKAKQEIGRLIEKGVADKRTAKFELKNPTKKAGAPKVEEPGKEVAIFEEFNPNKKDLAEADANFNKDLVDGDEGLKADVEEDLLVEPEANAVETFTETLRVGAPKVRKDKVAVEAIKQGFDEGIIGMIKGGSTLDKTKMRSMVEKMRAGKTDAKKAALERPSDVAGESLTQRFQHVVEKNAEAGKSIDIEAEKLKGQTVEFGEDVDTFVGDLQGIGVEIGDDLTPNFIGSDIQGSKGAENVVKNVVERMVNLSGTPDAFAVHQLKRFIDEQVSYGKTVEGLTGKTERILKKLRRNLDASLDQKFDEYNRVNTTYSETRDAIDNLQDAAGRKIDLSGDNADKAAGTVLRRLLSNAQGRVNLLDSINELETVARQYGATFDDDILAQVLFADELDAVFGPVARTSLQGQFVQGAKTAARFADAPVSTTIDKAVEGVEKLRGINEENAFKTIEELLNK